MFGKMGDMAKMMGQLKDVKSNIDNAQQKVRGLSNTTTLNGVTVTIDGNHMIIDIKIQESALRDKEMLEDTLIEALNQANTNVLTETATIMKEATGGIDLPFS